MNARLSTFFSMENRQNANFVYSVVLSEGQQRSTTKSLRLQFFFSSQPSPFGVEAPRSSFSFPKLKRNSYNEKVIGEREQDPLVSFRANNDRSCTRSSLSNDNRVQRIGFFRPSTFAEETLVQFLPNVERCTGTLFSLSRIIADRMIFTRFSLA